MNVRKITNSVLHCYRGLGKRGVGGKEKENPEEKKRGVCRGGDVKDTHKPESGSVLPTLKIWTLVWIGVIEPPSTLVKRAPKSEFNSLSQHLLMKISCLLSQFYHHGLVEELVDAHILAHSLPNSVQIQRYYSL